MASEAKGLKEGKEVRLLGWVHSVRDLGKIRFIILRDKSGLIQLVISRSFTPPEAFEEAAKLRKEYVVEVKGVVSKTGRAPGGAEVHVKSLKVLREASVPTHLEPDQHVKLSMDERLDGRILDLRRPSNMALFKINAEVLKAIRAFLDLKGFIEVHTPRIIATATEGGAALFPIAYYDKEAFLTQSPQLFKEQLTSVFEAVYEIGPLFRAEESHTVRHVSEFIGVDVEQAFATEEDVMKLLEELIYTVVKHVKEKCSEDLKELGVDLKVPTLPFKRLDYAEAVELLRQRGFDIRWGEDLSTEAERILGTIYPEPHFIVNWPTKLKPFYIMYKEDNPEICYAFDLSYGWIEIASGGRRVHDKEILVRRLKDQGLNPEAFQYHLKVFDWGMPPHAGWGLGLARLMMAITNRENIREVILFPRDRWRLTP
ncbi:MAG: aspartate--tRNA(Asn) ligase [Candidatus Nezhaarchaeales archaeon]